MKNKIITGLFVFLIIGLSIIPITNAGFIDNLFKGYKLEKKVITAEEKVIKKDVAEVKTLNKEAKLTKDVTKTERMEINFANGLKWEKAIKDYFCKSKINCFKTKQVVQDNDIGYGINRFNHKKDFTIIDDTASREYIKNHIDQTFTKKPDILNVYGDELYGKPKRIEIVDAKLSENAIRDEQDIAFKELCIKAKRQGIECSVIYAEPKSNLKERANAVCSISFLVPNIDPLDVGCLIIAFA